MGPLSHVGRGSKMILIISSLLLGCSFFLLCCAPKLSTTGSKAGPHAPVIERFFCPSVIRSGDVLKFFISGKDEGNDLGYIAVDVWHMGAWEESAPYINLPDRYGHELSGYLYLFTPQVVMFGETIRVSVTLIDKAGQRSNTVSQTVYFGDKPPPDCPAGWEQECNAPLGPINVVLRPFQQGGFSIVPRPL